VQDAFEILPTGGLPGVRRPWSDGTCGIVFSPVELIEKLAALVPRPRIHLLIYHGVFAPNARIWRDAVASARGAMPPAGSDEPRSVTAVAGQ